MKIMLTMILIGSNILLFGLIVSELQSDKDFKNEIIERYQQEFLNYDLSKIIFTKEFKEKPRYQGILRRYFNKITIVYTNKSKDLNLSEKEFISFREDVIRHEILHYIYFRQSKEKKEEIHKYLDKRILLDGKLKTIEEKVIFLYGKRSYTEVLSWFLQDKKNWINSKELLKILNIRS